MKLFFALTTLSTLAVVAVSASSPDNQHQDEKAASTITRRGPRGAVAQEDEDAEPQLRALKMSMTGSSIEEHHDRRRHDDEVIEEQAVGGPLEDSSCRSSRKSHTSRHRGLVPGFFKINNYY